MSDSNKLVADVRTEFGKGFARRLRAAGKIPAVVYGHGSDVKHVALPAHETGLIVRHANSIIELDIDGATELVFVKDVQREPVRSYIEHIDLVVVKRGEKIEVEVPVITEGETFSGTYLSAIVNTIRVNVDALNIPEHITVSVAGLEDGAQIHAKDISLPEGSELVDDADLLLLTVTANAAEEDEDAEEAAE
jgi:large subunit ribosomal protein L25